MSESPERPIACLSVLVVDDSEDNAEMLAQLIEGCGHRARVAHDGQTSLTLLEEEVPDLVVLDVGLPGMDGFDVAADMRRRFGDAFCIAALTGHSDSSYKERARLAGMNSFITKPIRMAQLQALLAEALRSRAEQRR